MSDNKVAATVPTISFPMGCTLFLVDVICALYIITHWGEVVRGVAAVFHHLGL